MELREDTLRVRRTARYYTAGPPPGEARAAWVVLHGYGQRADDFAAQFAAVVEAGSCVVAPEALSRFYPEGTRGRVGASWMTRAHREAEIADYLAYLDALVERLFGKRPLPLHVLGFSQGAATAARWAARRLGRDDSVQSLTLWATASTTTRSHGWLNVAGRKVRKLEGSSVRQSGEERHPPNATPETAPLAPTSGWRRGRRPLACGARAGAGTCRRLWPRRALT